MNNLIRDICDYYCKNGYTMDSLAECIGVTKRTLQKWKNTKIVPHDSGVAALKRFLSENGGKDFLPRFEKNSEFPASLSEEDTTAIRNGMPKADELKMIDAVYYFNGDKNKAASCLIEHEKSNCHGSRLLLDRLLGYRSKAIETKLNQYEQAIKKGEEVLGIKDVSDWGKKVLEKTNTLYETNCDIEKLNQAALDEITASYERRKTMLNMIKGKENQEKLCKYNTVSDILLSENVSLHKKDKGTYLNGNVIMIGASGTGKSRFFIEPNLKSLPEYVNPVIMDNFDILLEKFGKTLGEKGREVLSFNLSSPENSIHINPLAYVDSEKDLEAIFECIMPLSSADSFFHNSEMTLFKALFYQFEEKIPRTVPNLTDIAQSLDAFISESKYATDPESKAAPYFNLFKTLPDRTRTEIAMSLSLKLSIYKAENVRTIIADNSFDLTHFFDEKKALFIHTENVVKKHLAALFKMILMILAKERLKRGNKPDDTQHVRLILDDFGNIGSFPYFLESLLVSRWGMSMHLFVQTINQLKACVSDYEEVIAACDIILAFAPIVDYETTTLLSKITKLPENDITLMKAGECVIHARRITVTDKLIPIEDD